MKNSFLLKEARLSDGAITDLEVRNGQIVAIGNLADAADVAGKHEVIYDAKKNLLLPGLVDLHTHLRQPGKEGAETVLTGSMAAVRGGYTAVSAMANTSPVADSAGVVEQVARLGREAGLCDVFPIGAITQGLEGKALAELSAMAQSQAQVRIFSDDGNCLSDPLLMRRALEYVKAFGGVIAQHAQEPRLTQGAQMNEGVTSSVLGLTGWPAVAEESIIARDILLAHHVQSRLHICHLTTKGGVELVRWAKSQGINVTAEVTPHHLLLTDESAIGYDATFKVNPPLRTNDDVQALRDGLADGTIDIVATDHAPHPAEAKECEWNVAAFGMLGLETALSAVVEAMISTKKMSWSTLAERMSSAPAKIGGYVEHGAIGVGSTANFILVDTEATWTVDRTKVASKSQNTPFHNRSLPARVLSTYYKGILVHNDGQLTGNKYE